MASNQEAVKAGYKQTEVGVIPEDWEVARISQITTLVVSGKSSKQGGSSSGYFLYGSTGVIGLCSTPEYSGDSILVARVGANAGTINVATGEYGVSDNTIIIKLINNVCFDYIYYQLLRKNLNTMVFGSGQPLITGTQIKNLNLPIPPESEQVKIAKALSDSDARITALNALIHKKEQIKQGAMQQLLTGKVRLQGFGEGVGVKQTELGEIPEDWEVVELKNHVEINSGESPSRFEFYDEGIPYFKVEQLNNGFKYASQTPYKIRTNKVIEAGSVIFPKRGASILLNKIRILSHDSFMDTNLMTLTTFNGLVSEYLYFRLSFQGLAELADTTSVPQINNKHINPLVIPLPEEDEQKAISTALSSIDADIHTLKQRLTKTKALKQGMMQELLTGKTRLVPAATLAEGSTSE